MAKAKWTQPYIDSIVSNPNGREMVEDNLILKSSPYSNGGATFYAYVLRKRKKIGDNQSSDHRCFKNKVLIKLLDGSQRNAHIIHWCCNDGYFCITNDVFWDNLEDK